MSWGRICGGYIIRRNDLPIGLVFDGELYLKVNSRNLSDYQELNNEPFSYIKTRKDHKAIKAASTCRSSGR